MSFRLPIRRGEDHPAAKLNNQQRRQVKDALGSGARISDLAKSYQVNRNTIRRIGQRPQDWLK